MKDKWMKYLIKAVLFTMLLLTMPVGVSAAAKVEKVTYPKVLTMCLIITG